MKLDYPALSKEALCRLFGKTRHALYDRQKRGSTLNVRDEIVLQLVQNIRTDLPRIGTRKLLFMLQPVLESHRIKIGRDALFELLADHGLLVRRRKRKVVTTDSRHWMRKYKNLLKDIHVHRPEQVWVSDITYIKVGGSWGYLSMITDAYSRKIMGVGFRMDMYTEGCLTALEMALSARCYNDQPLIHHSDRGAQYCSREYIDLLQKNQIAVSMTDKGDPYENALAERMNGIIKSEFVLQTAVRDFSQTHELIMQSVDAYNNLRPHGSCNYLTPAQAHLQLNELPKKWKSYPKKWQQKQTAQATETTAP